MIVRKADVIVAKVAPVRERGLKYHCDADAIRCCSRSRKGAWIEIFDMLDKTYYGIGRSRKGAWIEIGTYTEAIRTAWRRSRKGAWIEIKFQYNPATDNLSRSRKGAWIEIQQT